MLKLKEYVETSAHHRSDINVITNKSIQKWIWNIKVTATVFSLYFKHTTQFTMYIVFCTLHTEHHTCSHVCGKSSSWWQRLSSSGITVYAIASLFALADMSMCWKYLDYTVEVVIVWIIWWWFRHTVCALPVSLLHGCQVPSAKYKSHCGKFQCHC